MSGRVLVVKTTMSGDTTVVNQLIDVLLEKWRGEGIAASQITTRNFSDPNAVLDSKGIAGFLSPDPAAKVAAVVAASEKMVAEAKQHDVIVIGTPTNNFLIATYLRMWFDVLTRAQQTFRSGPMGAEGILQGKKAIVVSAHSGADQSGSASSDHVMGYVTQMLDFVGIKDVTHIKAEGFRSSDPKDAALASARAEIAALPRLVAGAT